jgi:hypothetical protein
MKRHGNIHSATTLMFFLMGCVGWSNGCSMSGSDGVVEEMSPPPNSSAVQPQSTVFIRTDLPLCRTTENDPQALIVYDTTGGQVEGRLELSENHTKLSFIAEQPLKKNRNYRVCISSRIQTQGGGILWGYRPDPDIDVIEDLDDVFCYEFTTTSTLTIRMALFLATENVIKIYFSQELSQTSLQQASIRIMQSDREHIAGLRYNPTQSRLTLYPPPEIDPQKPFSIHLPANLETLDGHALNAGDGNVIHFDGPEIKIW